MNHKKSLAASISVAIVALVGTLPFTSHAMMDMYRNIETGFIEFAQSIRITGNTIVTGNL